MDRRFYRIEEVIGNRKKGIPAIIPVSRASWYAGVREGRYPAPVKLGEKSSAWLSTDIEELITRLSSSRKCSGKGAMEVHDAN